MPIPLADSARIAELLAQDRHKLLLRQPFTGAVVMRLDLRVERAEGLETAATDGSSIRVNPDFYASLNDDERLFVIAHEAWHCILMHFARRRNRDHSRFNIAADLEIHFLLTKEGFRPPFVLPHDPSWNGLSAEEIYERLPQPPNAPPRCAICATLLSVLNRLRISIPIYMMAYAAELTLLPLPTLSDVRLWGPL